MKDLSWQNPMIRGMTALKPLCLGLALCSMPTLADEGAAEYREHVMEAIGGHMQAAADIARGKVPHQDQFSLHIDALAELGGIVDTLFPEGSEGGDALPAIWENPDDFSARVADLEEATVALKTAVDGGGDVGTAFQGVGQACKSCHDDYREDD